MHESLENLCEALDGLATKVLAAWNDDRTLNTVHGWNHPALTNAPRSFVACVVAFLFLRWCDDANCLDKLSV